MRYHCIGPRGAGPLAGLIRGNSVCFCGRLGRALLSSAACSLRIALAVAPHQGATMLGALGGRLQQPAA